MDKKPLPTVFSVQRLNYLLVEEVMERVRLHVYSYNEATVSTVEPMSNAFRVSSTGKGGRGDVSPPNSPTPSLYPNLE